MIAVARPPGALLALAAALAGCVDDEAQLDPAEGGEPTIAPVATARGWWEIAAEDDPLADHRPPMVICPHAAWGPEGATLEVQTGVCNYFSVAHETLVELAPGDRLRVDLWHESLDAREPATAHLAVLLDGRVIAERTYTIPSEARVDQLLVELDEPVRSGSELVLHLHNHGFNSWSFLDVVRLR